MPLVAFLRVLRVALEAGVVNLSAAFDESLAALQVFGYAVHLEVRHQIIFLGEITHCPQQASRDRFGARFHS